MLETLPMWSNVQPQLQPHPRRMKISKVGNHLERSRRSNDGFSNLFDESRRCIAKESRALAKVDDSVGLEPHQPCAACIGSYRVIRKHDLSQRTSRAVEGPVSFHCHNAVRDHKVDRNSCS
jgi:hypothetical protein